MGVCRDQNVNLYARFRSEREDWLQAMALARIGFAFMPKCSVTVPELLQWPLIEPEVTRTISLVSLASFMTLYRRGLRLSPDTGQVASRQIRTAAYP